MKVIIYGAGFYGEKAFSHFGAENIDCFCDTKLKDGEEKTLCGKKVISFSELQKICKEHVIVISAGVNYNAEIGRQLDAVGIKDYFEFPLLVQMMGSVEFFMEQIQTQGGRDNVLKRYYKALAERTGRQLAYLKEHADIMTLKPAKGHMREEQIKLLKFASAFFDYISELQIRPFLTFGNLIGAFRHKGFVPWDDDWDFGIIRNELNRLLEFAERNCKVGTRCGDTWKGTSGEEMPWREIFSVYPEKYIFDIRPDMIHIYQNAFCGGWRAGMDLWVFDYYKEGYSMMEHRKWLEELDMRLHKMESPRDKVMFLKKERENNPHISLKETGHIFPGIDCLGGYPGRKDVGEWIKTGVIFPLKKVPYEDTEFWAPNDMETLLGYEYRDYLSFPDDVGLPIHIGMDE